MQLLRAEFAGVADPEIHVTLLGLGDCTQAAHQKQAMNRLGLGAALRFVDEGTGESLRFGEQVIVRLKAAEARRREPGDIPRQQWMIDVKQQGQQREHHLLACRQRLHGPRQATLVEQQEARPQLGQDLAVDAFVDVGTDFLSTAHTGARAGDLLSLSGALRLETCWQGLWLGRPA